MRARPLVQHHEERTADAFVDVDIVWLVLLLDEVQFLKYLRLGLFHRYVYAFLLWVRHDATLRSRRHRRLLLLLFLISLDFILSLQDLNLIIELLEALGALVELVEVIRIQPVVDVVSGGPCAMLRHSLVDEDCGKSAVLEDLLKYVLPALVGRDRLVIIIKLPNGIVIEGAIFVGSRVDLLHISHVVSPEEAHDRAEHVVVLG